MKQTLLSRIGSWIDHHGLFVLTCILFVFIPLYPKLPLFDIIPGYLVRVRVEDFLVLITVGFWGIQVFRGKQPWKTPLTFAVGLYALAGLLSIISGVLITQTIPGELLHIGKSGLHFFRYMEYFSLLFVVAAGVTSKERLKILLAVITITVLAISFYGYGQRYWYWPVYSTMNREFSKGIRLYLTEHARVQSTFGGHYDLAAYMVLVLPLIISGMYLLTSKWVKVALSIVFLGGLWTLVQTASRSSFAAYFLALAVFVFLLAGLEKTWLKKSWKLVSSGVVLLVVSSYMVVTFGSSMYERLMQSLAAYPELEKQYIYWNDQRRIAVENSTLYVVGIFTEDEENKTEEIKKNIAKINKATPPPNAISTDDLAVIVSSDTRPTPADVVVDVPDLVEVATTSADGTTTTTIEERPRTYSDAALQHGLSMAIRIDTLWPRALEGFYRNPAFGTGYATLTKEEVGQFTEAESTDNNFLRTLGETGAFGFITFYGIVFLSMAQAWVLYRSIEDRVSQVFVIGFLSGSVGLLLNAALIDVYAASKVAFTYWSLAGVIMALGYFYNKSIIIPQPAFVKPELTQKKTAPQKKSVQKRSRKS